MLNCNFYCSMRGCELSYFFKATPKQFEWLKNEEELYLGEVMGKHSEVTIERDNYCIEWTTGHSECKCGHPSCYYHSFVDFIMYRTRLDNQKLDDMLKSDILNEEEYRQLKKAI